MKWYLIAKGDEFHFGRFTDTRVANEKRRGWEVVESWRDYPTTTKIGECMWYWTWSQAVGVQS